MSASDGPGKVEEIKELLADLNQNLSQRTLSPEEAFETLQELKIHGRDPQDADAIFEKAGLQTLAAYAFGKESPVKAAREAMRVLANALLLKPATRQIVSDLSDGGKKVLEREGSFNSVDDEFLSARVLFLLTYGTNADFNVLVSKYGLAEKLKESLNRHTDANPTKRTPALGLMREMALAESLKLVFNVAHLYPATLKAMSTCTASILSLVQNIKAPPLKPLVPPITLMLNALLNLEFTKEDSKEALYDPRVALAAANSLLTVLDDATRNMPTAELEAEAVPLVTVIRKLYSLGDLELQHLVEQRVLPAEEERAEPLGRGDRTVAARLLKLSTAAAAATLGGHVSVLLYECSGRDAERFVRNVGFGHASGFLVNNNLPLPQGAGEGARPDVNFVTGQLLDREQEQQAVGTEAMSLAEREREAERLFVLFERLRATGVVDVVNPVGEAARSGRLQEIASDDDDESD